MQQPMKFVSAEQLAQEYADVCQERLSRRYSARSSATGSPRSNDNSPRESIISILSPRLRRRKGSGPEAENSPRETASPRLSSSGDVPMLSRRSGSPSGSKDSSPRWFQRARVQQVRTETLIEGVNLYEYVSRLHGATILLEYDSNIVAFAYRDKVLIVTMPPDACMDVARVLNVHFSEAPLCITQTLYNKLRKRVHMFDQMMITIFIL